MSAWRAPHSSFLCCSFVSLRQKVLPTQFALCPAPQGKVLGEQPSPLCELLPGSALGQGIMGEMGAAQVVFCPHFVQTERPVDLFYTSDNKIIFGYTSEFCPASWGREGEQGR